MIQEISGLYRDLIDFDSDWSRKSKMYKRRIDMLSPILEQINGNIYVEFVRQLSHEVAHCYVGMLDCKVPPNAKPANAEVADKANKL